MYALVLVVGDLIDRIGRPPALVGGLVLMALSTISLLWITSVPALAFALFVLGLGWNLSFVAATAQLADCTLPQERGKLLGFNDLLSGLTGASLALLGGYALTAIGVTAPRDRGHGSRGRSPPLGSAAAASAGAWRRAHTVAD